MAAARPFNLPQGVYLLSLRKNLTFVFAYDIIIIEATSKHLKGEIL